MAEAVAVAATVTANVRREIDIHESEQVDADAFKRLIRVAVALNTARGKASRRRAK